MELPPQSDTAGPPLAELERIDADKTLIDFMRQRDVACPMCKYNLRNLTTLECPECGSRLALGVQQADPYLRAWITGTIALALPCGFSLLFFIVTVHEHHMPHPSTWIEFYLLAFILVSPLLLAGMLFLRRRFMLLNRPLQRMLAFVCVINDVVALSILLFELFKH